MTSLDLIPPVRADRRGRRPPAAAWQLTAEENAATISELAKAAAARADRWPNSLAWQWATASGSPRLPRSFTGKPPRQPTFCD
jgi:hypothetical protein